VGCRAGLGALVQEAERLACQFSDALLLGAS
jgi:hypothetical protein